MIPSVRTGGGAMSLTFVEVPVDVQGSPFADSRNRVGPADPPDQLASRSDGPLPDEERIATRPMPVIQNSFRPGGRVERRPSGIHQPPEAVYALTSRGAALAAAVQFVLNRTNDATLDADIERKLAHLRPQALLLMRQHRYGGVLAVAVIIGSFDPSWAWGPARAGEQPPSTGAVARRCDAAYLTDRVFALPMHAISVWRHSQNVEPAPAPEGEFRERRFFWGEWT
jgi:hypothetical protein